MPDQPHNEKRAAKRVNVPNVVGRHFLNARDMAQSAGVALANPDPDGPPNLARNLETPPPSVDSAHASPEKPAQTIALTSNIDPDEMAP